MDSEEWRPVLGYEGYYEVSSLGRVRSLPRIRSAKRRKGTQFTMRMAGRVLVLCLNKSGYLAGNMCIEGQRKNFAVHRLVCEAFHGPAPDGQQAAHKDGVRKNCYASNLRRSEEHTSELQSLMRISYAVFCLKKKKQTKHA